MEQDSGESEPEEEHSAEYWKTRMADLRQQRIKLSECALDLYKSGKITKTEATQVFHAFNDVAVYHSGSTGRKDDALSYALYRDAIHQMRRTLLGLRSELRAELEQRFPEHPSRS